MHSHDRSAPDVPLGPELAARLNVISAACDGNAGLLRGELPWPATFQRRAFEADVRDFEAKLSAAREQARRGPLKGGLSLDLLDATYDMESKLERIVRTTPDEVRATECVRATRFLKELRQAVRSIHTPEGLAELRAVKTVRGETVEDLVRSMTEQGLKFAPSSGNNEGAYLALHQALATYHNRLHAKEQSLSPGLR
jgi:hypothetical protein